MGLHQVLNSLSQILHSDSPWSRYAALGKYMIWQLRRITATLPVELSISASRINVSGYRSLSCLVSCLGMYDANNMRFVQRVLTNTKGVLIDVGANIGTYTLIGSEIPGSQVIAFEPHPRTFSRLEQNMRINNRMNVVLFNVALSDRDTELNLTDGLDPCTNRIDVSASSGPHVTVRVRTLKGILDSYDLGDSGSEPANAQSQVPVRKTILKIDVEGHELEVLRGLEGLENMPLVLMVEDGERREVEEHAHQLGFLGPFFYHWRTAGLRYTPQARREDALYVHRDAVKILESFGIPLPRETHKVRRTSR